MDFGLSDDQAAFRDVLLRWADDAPQGEKAKETWRGLADLGATAALLPESADGLGLGPVEAMLIGDALGRRLATVPFVETVAIAATLLHRIGSPAHAPLLQDIARGDATVAIAGSTRNGAHPLECGLSARPDEGGWMLSGPAPFVVHAPEADLVLFVTEGHIFLVPRQHLPFGDAWSTIDSAPAASIATGEMHLAGSCLLADRDGEALDAALDLALLIQSAEIGGLCALLLNATAEHLRTRRQFGQPLASFQALQHRFSEMALLHEQATSLVIRAAAQTGDDRDRGRAASAAMVQAATAARLIGDEAIQMHGAMGMTEELNVGPAVKRLRALGASLGSPHWHRQRFRMLAPAGPAA